MVRLVAQKLHIRILRHPYTLSLQSHFRVEYLVTNTAPSNIVWLPITDQSLVLKQNKSVTKEMNSTARKLSSAYCLSDSGYKEPKFVGCSQTPCCSGHNVKQIFSYNCCYQYNQICVDLPAINIIKKKMLFLKGFTRRVKNS